MLALPAVVFSLAFGGTALADGHGHGGGNYSGQGTHFGWAFGRGDAPYGSVQSYTNSTLTVLEFDGTTQTFAVTTTTQVYLDGKLAQTNAIEDGLNVDVMAPHYWGSTGGGTTTTPNAYVVYLISPSVLGSVQSVTTNSTGDLISVLNPQGFAFSIQTSATTNFYVSGTSSTTPPTFTTGEIVAALGLVDSTNKDQLDATQVRVGSAHKSSWWPTSGSH
jgi:hypothetical protein